MWNHSLAADSTRPQRWAAPAEKNGIPARAVPSGGERSVPRTRPSESAAAPVRGNPALDLTFLLHSVCYIHTPIHSNTLYSVRQLIKYSGIPAPAQCSNVTDENVRRLYLNNGVRRARCVPSINYLCPVHGRRPTFAVYKKFCLCSSSRK